MCRNKAILKILVFIFGNVYWIFGSIQHDIKFLKKDSANDEKFSTKKNSEISWWFQLSKFEK